jgi:hypothetical protein
MQQVASFFQGNLTLVLVVSLVAVSCYALGLLTRRRHVIQILPAPVSPGLERAISSALASREIVYVQAAPAPVYAKTASGERRALAKPEDIVHEIEQVVSKLAHEIAAAFDAAAKDLLLTILGHMEHHSDDAWFAQMQDKIEHAKTNADLSACAAEMIKHLHGGDGH